MKKALLWISVVFLVFAVSCGRENSNVDAFTFEYETIKIPETNEYISIDSTYETETQNIDVIPEGNKYSPCVLMYHLVLEEPTTSLEDLFVRPADFDAQIKELIDNGYQFMFADEYHKTDIPTVIITFDDGYSDNYSEAFPILQKYNVKATVFMITDAIGHEGYLSAEQMKEMSDSGLVRFGSHTHNHLEVASLDSETLRTQLETSKQRILEVTGRECADAFCYPAGNYNSNSMSVVSEYFTFAFTTESPYKTTDYSQLNIPRYRVKRSTGGNISRLLPDL